MKVYPMHYGKSIPASRRDRQVLQDARRRRKQQRAAAASRQLQAYGLVEPRLSGRPNTAILFWWIAAILTILGGIFTIVIVWNVSKDISNIEPIGDLPPQTSQVAPYDVDPCGLTDVVCAKEKPQEDQVAAQKRVFYATVTTYQAVPQQTDSTPCQGAMPHINFCDPPQPLAASNTLPLGTKIMVRDVVYLVADRMNPRYDGNHVDLLTNGDNFKLHAEPVTIL